MTTELSGDLKQLVADIAPEVIRWRRHLHANPELSFEEEKTAGFVFETLKSFGNIELTRPTKTSVVGKIKGDFPGKTLAIRADMDALPIKEENTFEFASKNPGVMHACGHDGHTSMLLGAAKILSQLKAHLRGEIRLIFQHAEELFPGGAEELVNAGVMDGVDWVIGAHLWSPLEYGKIGIVYGPMMAAPDTFHIVVKGKGGHAAIPHAAIDSIAVASQVVTNLQHVVSRNTNPLDSLVLSVAKFIGGTAHNVIPGSVELTGTIRSFNPELRDQVPELMERVIKGVTSAHGADYEFNYEKGYRPVINHAEVTKIVEKTVKNVYGSDSIKHMAPSMIGEDFSAYQQAAPGMFFYIGAGNEDKGMIYPHHHARFTIDEEALEKGVNIFVHAAFHFLNE
ncbi:amidohydrolase [Scopulibacillus daqui]|uniref:Amidohydrolase n=1 Tax=Scopulibacillus daqui TaxID=1469162 RepID=A0ABS2PXC9_9BACL|nr:M20 family metallopeptidase [Scopulibacillus daqui]MBM7644235.1 amidohydrolase [Scopulibacillus daqui]